MRAGQLRHLADIQVPTQVRTTGGGFTQTWASVGEAWLSIQPLQGREFFENESINGEVTHKIRARADVSIPRTARLVVDDRTFNVLSSVDASERGITLEITAKETT